MAALSYAVMSFLLTLITHVACAMVFPSVNRVKSFLVVGALVGVGQVLVALYRWPLEVVVPSVVLYAFLCELYLFAFTLALGSISANLLMRLRHGPLLPRTLNEHYSGELMTRIRLDRLCQSGFLEKNGEGWVPTARARRLAKLFAKLRRFFRHDQAASNIVA